MWCSLFLLGPYILIWTSFGKYFGFPYCDSCAHLSSVIQRLLRWLIFCDVFYFCWVLVFWFELLLVNLLASHTVRSCFLGLIWLFACDFCNAFVRYCECFASGVYCDGCNCANCCNNVENEAARHEAVEATLERNPNAFRPKIGSSPHAIRDNRVCIYLYFGFSYGLPCGTLTST